MDFSEVVLFSPPFLSYGFRGGFCYAGYSGFAPSSFELVSIRHEFLENYLIGFGPELWFGVAHRSGANYLSTISIAVNSDSFSSATQFGVIL